MRDSTDGPIPYETVRERVRRVASEIEKLDLDDFDAPTADRDERHLAGSLARRWRVLRARIVSSEVLIGSGEHIVVESLSEAALLAACARLHPELRRAFGEALFDALAVEHETIIGESVDLERTRLALRARIARVKAAASHALEVLAAMTGEDDGALRSGVRCADVA